ncbi:hypothetical protein, partial [Halomonas sp. DQ26W]|uniref:hypothetical protein n=1 Tax=Halomonas sp. DQ26W TaxID=2282311 RepID=UPI001C6976FE
YDFTHSEWPLGIVFLPELTDSIEFTIRYLRFQHSLMNIQGLDWERNCSENNEKTNILNRKNTKIP